MFFYESSFNGSRPEDGSPDKNPNDSFSDEISQDVSKGASSSGEQDNEYHSLYDRIYGDGHPQASGKDASTGTPSDVEPTSQDKSPEPVSSGDGDGAYRAASSHSENAEPSKAETFGSRETEKKPTDPTVPYGSSLYGTSAGNNSASQYIGEDIQNDTSSQKKRGKTAKRIIAALLVLIVLGSAIGVFTALFDVRLNYNGALLSILRRSEGSTVTTSQPSTVPHTPQGDPNGPTMDINSLPSTADEKSDGTILSISQINDKVTKSTVGVISTADSMYSSSTSSGTGIIMSDNGYIITNNHVIENATSVAVMLMDGTTYPAKIVGADERTDLAVLKIEATGLPAAEFGDSDQLKVGEEVVAIGNPLGLDLMGTVTNGIVSAINRDVMIDEFTMTLIQTNAALNPGNSGGPLVNMYGQVIGINTLKMMDYYTTVEGLGFAIPTNTAKEIVDQLITNGYVKGRPTIGISGRTITQAISDYYGFPRGLIVDYVNPYSDAYAQGLQINDIIVKANGQAVVSADEINAIKEEFTAGDSFTVTVYRDGMYRDITFILMDEAELPEEQTVPMVP